MSCENFSMIPFITKILFELSDPKLQSGAGELSWRRNNDGKQARYFAHDLPYRFALEDEPGT